MNLLAARRGRAFLLACLYFSEGAPIGWLWWSLPPRLREAGAPVDEVTALTAVLALPWALKFLWAPLVDGLRSRRFGLRGWIVAAQAAMAAALLPLLGDVDLTAPQTFAPLLLAHAFCAATQDVAVDGLAIRALPVSERGKANGWMQIGMLAARGIFGGLALRAEEWIGFDGVVLALIGCILSSSLLVLFLAREPDTALQEIAGGMPLRERLRSLLVTIGALFRARRTWAGLCFAVLAGAAFEAVGGTAGSLLVDLGNPKERVGDFYALPVILCMAAGSLAGGVLADRVPRLRAAAIGVLLVSACVAVLAAGLLAGARGSLVLVLLAAVYLALGALSTSSYALFMDLSPSSAGATQFSAFAGATNLCESWAVFAAGRIAALPGEATPASYAAAWLALAAVSLFSLNALGAIRRAP